MTDGSASPGRPRSLSADLARIEREVAANASRVAAEGGWPSWISVGALSARVPSLDRRAEGFDAGIACALDLIPRDKQRLSARLHANYSAAAIGQVRREIEVEEPSPDAEAVWWLAACHLCREEGVNAEEFLAQIEAFSRIVADPSARVSAAKAEFQLMRSSFHLDRGYPFGERDGCILGAYLSGYSYGVFYSPETDEYFIGTLLESLGLDDFSWTCDRASEQSCRSGPVAGSRQYVCCVGENEFNQAIKQVQRAIPIRPERG